MPKQQRKPPRPHGEPDTPVPAHDRLKARGLDVSYDWELDHVPSEYKSDAELEKVRRQAANKDYRHPLSEVAKLLGVKETTLRARLSRSKARFPADIHTGPRGREVRTLTESEIARLKEEMKPKRKAKTVPTS